MAKPTCKVLLKSRSIAHKIYNPSPPPLPKFKREGSGRIGAKFLNLEKLPPPPFYKGGPEGRE